MAKTKVRRVRVCARLSVELRDKLAKYCAASGISERTVIEDALQKHLDGTERHGAAPAEVRSGQA